MNGNYRKSVILVKETEDIFRIYVIQNDLSRDILKLALLLCTVKRFDYDKRFVIIIIIICMI